jgi:nicotinamide phosphoribosyltransferase
MTKQELHQNNSKSLRKKDKMNFILQTDSYKLSHYLQYPPKTEAVRSYIEARRRDTIFFGLQAFLKTIEGTIVTKEDVDEAEYITDIHGLPFNKEGWMYIVDFYDGKLPIEIEAVPEGTYVPYGVPSVQVINTDSKAFWLTSYIETALLRAVWYPSTVATTSFEIRKVITWFYRATSDAPISDIDFKLHDFGSRGVSSSESAELGGMAHLAVFRGSDNLEAVLSLQNAYNCGVEGFSVPAAEHSTMTSWGKDKEENAIANMYNQFKDGTAFSIVIDSYDDKEALNKICNFFKDKTSAATIVVRPDSGDPKDKVMMCLDKLAETFGTVTNSKGFKVLKGTRVIQGDGINKDDIVEILAAMANKAFSADNIVFGMGGSLLQGVTRDTCGFSMKASQVKVDGKWKAICKNAEGKQSKAGKQYVYKEEDGTPFASSIESPAHDNMFRTVFRDGEIIEQCDIYEVRKNIAESLAESLTK